MLAPPVGSSPSFRAVAFVCVVTSPNEVEPFSCRARYNVLPQSAALTFIRAPYLACQEKSATGGTETRKSKLEKSPRIPMMPTSRFASGC